MSMVFILRGLPGSGKSWFASQQKDATVCSSDQFHMIGGVYMYDQDRASEAHRWCLRKFVEAVKAEKDLIIVDNTNASSLEVAPYFRVARAHGYMVRFYEFKCSILDSIKHNIHGVPEDAICRMAMRLTRSLPVSWEEDSEVVTFESPHEKAEGGS